MATVKLATLVVRTLAKPIATSLKSQARQREGFRNLCVSLAQGLHRGEVHLRYNLLGQPKKAVRPLNEAAAIESGANFIAEGFLFAVAGSLIIAESWRTSRNASKRRDSVDDQLEELTNRVEEMRQDLGAVVMVWEQRWEEERRRNDQLSNVLERLVNVGLKAGWEDLGLGYPPIVQLLSQPEGGSPSESEPIDQPQQVKEEDRVRIDDEVDR